MKKVFGIITAAVMALSFVAVPAYASGTNPCDDYMGSNPPEICNTPGSEDDLYATIRRVLNAVYFWIGILAVAFIIVGGINLTTSQGNPERVKKARNTILYAIIGLIIAILAFAITQFVLDALGGNV